MLATPGMDSFRKSDKDTKNFIVWNLITICRYLLGIAAVQYKVDRFGYKIIVRFRENRKLTLC